MSEEDLPCPTKQGPAGRAWRCDIDAYRAKLGVSADDDATLTMWVIEAPWAHPLWHSYMLVLVHLRPMPDGRETKFYRDDATHELWLYAMDPGHPRSPIVLGSGPARWLTPKNFAAQLAEPSDSAALSKIEATVDLIIRGELNPDTDAAQQWRALFGEAMVKPEYRSR